MIDRKILASGRVICGSFSIDPGKPLTDQANDLAEDLLQIEYEDGVILDVGWYPEFSPAGHFRVMVVANSDWENPLYDRCCTVVPELIDFIRIGVNVAESISRCDKIRPIVLCVDNDPDAPTPTWVDVLGALLRMDGCERTLTCLEAPDGITLMVGGGNDGRFLVDYLVNREAQQNYVVTDPSQSGPDVELVCGGQAGGYPAHWCVDLGRVLDAVHHFCMAGGMAPHLSWEEST